MSIRIDEEFKNLIPVQTEEELVLLTKSCVEEGIREPLIVWQEEDILLDGHTRYRIALENDLDYSIKYISLEDKYSAINWIINNQLMRRNLSSMAVSELRGRKYLNEKTVGHGSAGQNDPQKRTSDKIAEEFGVGEATVRRDAEFVVALDKLEEVGISKNELTNQNSKYTKKDIIELSKIEKENTEKAKAIYNRIKEDENVNSVVEARQAIARDRIPEPAITPEFPTGKYHTIVLDPPWEIKKIEREYAPDQGVELDYPTMSLEEIEELPIESLSEDGCHLYLWVTQKYLPAGLNLVEKWGFKYQCIMTWVKPSGFTPFSWMYNTEHIIYAHKGGQKLLKMGKKLSIEAPTTGHSKKPQAFYDLVNECSPGPKLEMFARTPREGFVVWGNEVNLDEYTDTNKDKN